MPCDELSPEAVQFCAIGALNCAAPGEYLLPAYTRLHNAAVKWACNSAATLNDLTDHATVLKMYDAAIAKSQEREALDKLDEETVRETV